MWALSMQSYLVSGYVFISTKQLRSGLSPYKLRCNSIWFWRIPIFMAQFSHSYKQNCWSEKIIKLYIINMQYAEFVLISQNQNRFSKIRTGSQNSESRHHTWCRYTSNCHGLVEMRTQSLDSAFHRWESVCYIISTSARNKIATVLWNQRTFPSIVLISVE